MAYGVCYADYYLVEATAKPDEWDTYWNGNRSGIIYGVSSDTFIDATNKMMYKVENGKATLTKYLGSSSTIYIPRTVKGYTVTKIGNTAFQDKRYGFVAEASALSFHEKWGVVEAIAVGESKSSHRKS